MHHCYISATACNLARYYRNTPPSTTTHTRKLAIIIIIFFFAAGYVMAQDTVSLRNSFYTAFCFPIARHNIFPQKVLKSLLSVLYMLNKHDALENV